MDTNLSQAVDQTNENARYDESIKEVLADKQVLARIIKYSLEEFEAEELDTIMQNIGTPVISKIPVDPGLTNLSKVEKTSEEDIILGEGKILYDIRFSAYSGKELVKILINVEAQKSSDVMKLRYHLDNRIIYYLSRMISSQKGVEFQNSNYDDIKNVRSIWICMDSADNQDSINRIRLVQENIYGAEVELPYLNKVMGVIIRLRENENAEESKNKLIAMLEELLRKEDVNKKKQKLEEYGFIMHQEIERKINIMCNLSELVLERGIEQGSKKGHDDIFIIMDEINNGNSTFEGLTEMGYDPELVRKVLEKK